MDVEQHNGDGGNKRWQYGKLCVCGTKEREVKIRKENSLCLKKSTASIVIRIVLSY